MRAPVFIDMDDVLAETTRTYPGLVEREFGISATYEGIASFDLSDSFGLTQHQLDHLFEVVHSPDILMGFRPVPGARETLAHWQSLGYPIAIVTGRPPEAKEPSLAWLHENKIPFDSFEICDKYGRHPKGSSLSLSEIASRDYTLAVEDSLSMAAFLTETMETPTFLFDRPWNRRDNGCKARRASSWREIRRMADLS